MYVTYASEDEKTRRLVTRYLSTLCTIRSAKYVRHRMTDRLRRLLTRLPRKYNKKRWGSSPEHDNAVVASSAPSAPLPLFVATTRGTTPRHRTSVHWSIHALASVQFDSAYLLYDISPRAVILNGPRPRFTSSWGSRRANTLRA